MQRFGGISRYYSQIIPRIAEFENVRTASICHSSLCKRDPPQRAIAEDLSR